MLSKSLMLLGRLSRRLAVRVLLGALLALGILLLAPLIQPLIPDGWTDRFGRDSVLPILTILASSMLTVTTFSLSVMVQAFRAASSQATPRAYRLHLADTTTHTVLATFTGAFLYSLTAIALFRAKIYSDPAAVVVFWVTMGVIVAIVVAILRWIDHLSTLGSMDDTLEMAESHAKTPLRAYMESPTLGGVPIEAGTLPPQGSRAVTAERGGHVQFIDMARLEQRLSDAGAEFQVAAIPGAHVIQGEPLGWISGDGIDEKQIRACFTLGVFRTLEQDVRFGAQLLNEIAVRALSPAVNDPGTAIDVIRRLIRMLTEAGRPSEDAPRCPHISIVPASAFDLLSDAFDQIARDGANRPDVVGALLDGLEVLQREDWPELAAAARERRHYAIAHAEAAITVEPDRKWLQEKADRER
ncbi:DUF2254 domain-containing protein [Salipiger mucosus]|uniref:DUF2254 domain-containing protein n=1 Tax=Salipiger mucosus DSM 16094 TaxID=1123237 RepID=S9QT47_9RHOB|nr:DUF2254 domain-containing protein [Salipiger mucosus]EPX82833.1 hypothetical protein Salmuc_05186 [Salipiger mucosus DSM 16094]